MSRRQRDWELEILPFLPLLIWLPALWFIWSGSQPRNVELEIDDLSWVRSVEVLEVRPTRHEGWELPEGATLVSSEKRAYQYVKRRFEYRGTPVYADWYTYEIDEPVCVRTETASGGAGDAIEWPDVSLSEGQSVGKRTETLLVHAADGTEYEVSDEVWRELEVGGTVNATVTWDGRIEGVSHAGE
jgi:hypothetical protein